MLVSVPCAHVYLGEDRGLTTYDLALAVLSNYERIDTARSDACFGSERTTQTCGIEECTASNYLCGWKAGVLQGKVGKDIDWVGDQEEDGFLVEGLHVFDHIGQNGLVAADEVGTRFTCKVRYVISCVLQKGDEAGHLSSAPPPPSQ